MVRAKQDMRRQSLGLEWKPHSATPSAALEFPPTSPTAHVPAISPNYNTLKLENAKEQTGQNCGGTVFWDRYTHRFNSPVGRTSSQASDEETVAQSWPRRSVVGLALKPQGTQNSNTAGYNQTPKHNPPSRVAASRELGPLFLIVPLYSSQFFTPSSPDC